MALDELYLSLEGISVGDAFGASFLYPQAGERIARRELPAAPWRWTANTQMALAVAADLRTRGYIDQDSLARQLSWRYMTDSARGYGSLTRQLLERIAYGESWRTLARSQYADGSFGTGAVVRSIPIGGYFAGDPVRAGTEAHKAAEVTHSHPEGIAGAVAVAVAAALIAPPGHFHGNDLLFEICRYLPDSQIRQGILASTRIPETDLAEAARALGTGENYSAQDTVPFSLWCAAHHLFSFEEATWFVVSGLGRCNTTAAVVGGLVALGTHEIPRPWLQVREPLPVGYEYTQFGHGLASISSTPASDHEHSPANRPSRGDTGLLNGSVAKESLVPSVYNDLLTGLPNLLGLFEHLNQCTEADSSYQFHLVVMQLFSLYRVNRNQGRTAGDQLLVNCARALRKRFANGTHHVFRIGGDRFAVLFENTAPEEVLADANWIRDSINIDKNSLDYLPTRVALIHFGAGESAPGNLLGCLYEALSNRHYQKDQNQVPVFAAANIRAVADFPWMMVDLARQMMLLGTAADELLHMANTDSVSQLPNMRAAMTELETQVTVARRQQRSFGLLMIDGDNLRQYNQISYEAGDEAIRLMGETLRHELRETDFLARFRTGDEFLVLLPDIPREEVFRVGRRLCQAMERASRAWAFPTTISIGAAIFDENGETVQDLLRAAEIGLESAKRHGKNCAYILDTACP